LQLEDILLHLVAIIKSFVLTTYYHALGDIMSHV
jgi:hypothetical protein